MVKLGLEVFGEERRWRGRLEGNRVAFLGHSASVTRGLQDSFSYLRSQTPLKFSCILGPQHGFRGVQQANMITTEDAHLNNIPIFSLYSDKTRRLTSEMLDCFDVLLVDLQDVGCRVYTYLTTLFYVLEDCASAGKEVWILDRPNPAGRRVEGSILDRDFSSFVGAASLPIRHGLTLAEAASWYCEGLDVQLECIQMENYNPQVQPWPVGQPWVLPSPNMVDEECVHCYSGTVLLEGTRVSEARGTVFPLKAFGFPGMDARRILKLMQDRAPQWLGSCVLRPESFQPTFDKFRGELCEAIRIYASGFVSGRGVGGQDFVPYRLVSLFLKCLKEVHKDFDWILPPPYEYEYKKWPIDILSGDSFLREWIEDPASEAGDLEQKLSKDELAWTQTRKKFLFY